jgi:hypothetical protein
MGVEVELRNRRKGLYRLSRKLVDSNFFLGRGRYTSGFPASLRQFDGVRIDRRLHHHHGQSIGAMTMSRWPMGRAVLAGLFASTRGCRGSHWIVPGGFPWFGTQNH